VTERRSALARGTRASGRSATASEVERTAGAASAKHICIHTINRMRAEEEGVDEVLKVTSAAVHSSVTAALRDHASYGAINGGKGVSRADGRHLPTALAQSRVHQLLVVSITKSSVGSSAVLRTAQVSAQVESRDLQAGSPCVKDKDRFKLESSLVRPPCSTSSRPRPSPAISHNLSRFKTMETSWTYRSLGGALLLYQQPDSQFSSGNRPICP